jgi:hypothetical protein
MTENSNLQSFQDRINRIEERARVERDAFDEERKSKTVKRGGGSHASPQKRAIYVIFTLLMILTSGVVILQKRMPEKFQWQDISVDIAEFVPEELQERNRTVDIRSIENTELFGLVTNKQRPERIREETDTGMILRSPLVLASSGEELEIQDFTSGFIGQPSSAIPLSVSSFKTNTNCTFKRPRPTDIIHSVNINTASAPSAVQAISKAELASVIKGSVAAFTKHPNSDFELNRVDGTLRTVDVFVTDTRAPVYLVLQGAKSGIIWNVQSAPGVEIAHIAIIAGRTTGLVKPAAGVGYEAINYRKYSFQGDNPAKDPCPVYPWRSPQTNWIAFQKAQNDNQLHVNMISTFREGYTHYSRWYEESFGVPTQSNLVAAEGLDHVIVGPIPTERLAYRSLNNREVLITQTDYILKGTPETLAQRNFELHRDLLIDAAGGELALLAPQPMEVSQ